MGATAMRRGTLWVKEGEFVKPIKVRTGITDQIVTEVQGEGLSEGLEVVITDARPMDAAGVAGGTNPFAPTFGGRGRGGPGGAGGGGGPRGGGRGGG